jgi:GNAT superfamily N-acetyltransferase
MEIRKIHQNDIESVLQIQKLSYQNELQESADVFLSFLNHKPNMSFVMLVNNHIIGYIFTHIIDDHDNTPPRLNTVITNSLQKSQNSWFIHDMAFLSLYRGNGFGKLLFQHFIDATNPEYISLVAVNNAEHFWKKL